MTTFKRFDVAKARRVLRHLVTLSPCHLVIRRHLVILLLVCVGCSKQKSTEQLLADLQSKQERDRLIAVRLLALRKDDAKQVVPALSGVLKDGDSDIRMSAAIGLGYFGEQAREAIPALKAAQRDHDARVRHQASVALARIDPQHFSVPSAKGPTRKK